METQQYNKLFSFIWNIANDELGVRRENCER